jgi:protein TonB
MWPSPIESLESTTASTSIQTPVIKIPSPASLTHAPTRPAGGSISRASVIAEPVLPLSDEPIERVNQASSDQNSAPLLGSHEQQQAVDPVAMPAEAVVSAPPLESREQEMHSDWSPTTQPSLPREVSSSVPGQSANPVFVAHPDYGWLSETIMRRMQELKRYPAEARLDRAEGKVVLKAVIRSNGAVETVEIFQSSGHQSLDRAAVELLTQAGPFQFPRPLERPQMTVKIPMNYRLEP